MSKGTSSPTRSIFDYGEDEMENFWKQGTLDDFSNYALLIEDNFYYRKKSFFSDQASCSLAIKGTYLLYKTKKNSKSVEYINLEEFMYKVEVIKAADKRYSSKHKYAFSISTHNKSFEFYCKELVQFKNWMVHLRKYCIMTNINDFYKIREVIGSGGYGKVFLLENKISKERCAGKFIKISPLKSIRRQQAMIINEIKMLRRTDHEHIVKLFEVYEMDEEICMVMEYINGEKLFNYIVENLKLREEEAALILKQLLLVLHHLQTHDIIHRDIKPENVLFIRDDEGKIKIKIIDFGLGTFHTKRDIIKKCGTAGYVAPEILNDEPYDFSADLYSAGIVIMICLTGRPAFQAQDYQELLEKNKKGVIRAKGKRWYKLSQEVRHIIQGLTEMNPSTRMTISEALNHQWLTNNLPNKDKEDLAEYNFKFVKMNIPEEQKVSRVPISLSRSGPNSFVELTPSQPSQSFVNSQILGGKNSYATLNSFYKDFSRESSMSDKINNSSLSIVSRKSIQKRLSDRDNVLFIPKSIFESRGSTQPGNHRRSISLSPTPTNDLPLSRGVIEYKIQVSAIDSLKDTLSQSDDNDTPCGKKYMKLTKNHFHVRKAGRGTSLITNPSLKQASGIASGLYNGQTMENEQ